MKRTGILNPELLAMLGRWGHTDFITVCDRGFPVPSEPPRVDLTLVDDIPTVLDVLNAVQAEFTIDRILAAREMADISPHRVEEMRQLLPGVSIEFISHLELKRLSRETKGTIRTADTCPYGNVLIVSG